MFLLWKLKYLNEKTGKPFPTSVRELNFAEIDESDLIYNDKLIKLYQCGMWDKILKNDMNGLINSDPFCIEPLYSTEELSTIVNTKNVVENPLIARHNSRYQGTNLLDFLHGRCLRLQNFVFSVLKYDKSKFVPLCLECSSSSDSVYHKIFECQSYSSNEEIVDLRSQLTSLKELKVNFHLQLLFSDDLSFRKIFLNLVQLICRESKFKDEYLVRNDDSNE